MKTIKIFLASSDELMDDRNAFGNLVRRLGKIYEKRGIRIDLFEWEDYDAAYNNRRKQDEYNEQIKASDMFLALFHTKAGKFTIEEFNVATDEFKKHASPKIYTYCKDLQAGEQESPELVEFKRKLFEEMGHYWSRYNNRDSMQLHFVMQLQLVETSGMVEKLKLVDGTVLLEDMPIAMIDNLRFAAGNEVYQKMSAELAALPEKIEKAHQRVERYPDDDDLRDELQQKLDRYNKLKDEFAQLQKNLFETAQRIAGMQLEQVSDMLRRAIEAFEDGNLERANTLLDEIAHEAEYHMAHLEQQRALVHQDIVAFMLQAKTVMTDASIFIDTRILKVAAIYAKADDWSCKSALPEDKYETLLDDYGSFLSNYAQRLAFIREKLYGLESIDVAMSYNSIGSIHNSLANYDKALEYHSKALEIREKILGLEHSDTGQSYNNMGLVYDILGDYDKALEYYSKALATCEKALGLKHPNAATLYNNIGSTYYSLGDYDKALEYHSKALTIVEEVLGPEQLDASYVYHSIGMVFFRLGDFDKALEYHFKDLAICEKALGLKHPNTATAYNSIGQVFYKLNNYDKALEYYTMYLEICKKVYGLEHPSTGSSYNNVGLVYYSLGDYDKALKYYSMDLAICEKIYGVDHADTAAAYNNIGMVYRQQGDSKKALDYYMKALNIVEKKLGKKHPDTLILYRNISEVYASMSDFFNALDYYSKTKGGSFLDDYLSETT